MKTRVISALVGLVILAVVLVFFDTLVLNVTILAICIIAVLELLKATGCIGHPALVAVSMFMTLIIPFARWVKFRPLFIQAVFLVVIIFFLMLIKSHATLRIEQLAMAFFFSTVVPVFFSCAVFIRDDFGVAWGLFYVVLALGSAWLCDTGAYFTGVFLGKHKLAPHISPKKTVEGAVGGVVIGTGTMLLLALGYSWVMGLAGQPVTMNYLLLALCTPVFNLIGMLGDLSASVIKRQFGIKDFGHIMPGHGGVLDRFDSVLFTLPAVYILAGFLPIIS